jgi:hypothetical protein
MDLSPPYAINKTGLINLLGESARHLQRLYGMEFTKIMVKSAVEFEAKMTGDDHPPDAVTIQECKEYVTDGLQKYPDGFASIIYGIYKAESAIEGQADSMVRSAIRSGVLEMRYSMNKWLNGTEITSTTLGYRLLLQRAEKAGLLVGEPTINGDEKSVTVNYGRCHIADACRAILQEGIRRPDGSSECTLARSGSEGLKNLTGITHDFEVIEFNPPACRFRIFKLQRLG